MHIGQCNGYYEYCRFAAISLCPLFDIKFAPQKLLTFGVRIKQIYQIRSTVKISIKYLIVCIILTCYRYPDPACLHSYQLR